MTEHVIIGVDAGGTSTRCVVAALDGVALGHGRSGGANQYSSPDPDASLRSALEDALASAGQVLVRGAVFGMAGAAGAGHVRAAETAERTWRALGLPGSPHVTDDIAAAFAAGSAADEGTVLIAGTGAAAGYVRDGVLVRRCDGYGWLLGDEGSAVWIALRGLRAVLAALDGRGRPTVLCDRMAAALGVSPREREPVVDAVYARHPAELGRLAPAVTESASEGDPVAEGVVAEAAERLLSALTAVAPESPADAPVVLAGAVLAEGPVAESVRTGLRDRYGVLARAATEGALGAAGLALRRTGAPVEAHAALLRAVQPSPR